MALAAQIVNLIRDEIGHDEDFVDNTVDLAANPNAYGALEDIYTDTERGNTDVLRTALVCWRIRRANYVKRGFDASASGSLMSRRQRMKELDKIVKEYELLIETTHRHKNTMAIPAGLSDTSGTEFA